ncbi:MAG: HAD-IC family P-type ATPase, partial [Hespellia sp.]|nr:HAD-IC family P-type ATPase [Hespellia sp.]
SLRDSYGKPLDKERVERVEEFTGFGVLADIEGKKVYIGNAKFMKRNQIFYLPVKRAGTVVHVSVDTVYAGYILITDTIREEAKYTVEKLKHYRQAVVMLTGDNERAAGEVAKATGIEFVYSDLLPEEKVEQLEEFMESQLEEEKLVFVGDGINDAPVLARADVGIAMGGLGSDAAIEAADVILMEDDLSRIINAMKIARETMRVVKQNMIFAIGIKIALLILATIGFVTMRTAIMADMAVLVINIINSIWVVHYPE